MVLTGKDSAKVFLHLTADGTLGAHSYSLS